MLVLAIDTATDVVVTGVAELASSGALTVRAEQSISDHRRHAEVLTTAMSAAMTDAGVAPTDLDAVVVGCGPGPFTGLRVGMATAAAFGDALDVPVYGVCSLDGIAAAAIADEPGLASLLVVTDARRREIYWARYESGQRVQGPLVTAPAVVVDDLADVVVDAVAGSPLHAESFGRRLSDVAVPTVAGLVATAAADVRVGATPEPLEPLYLRRPDAVERAKP